MSLIKTPEEIQAMREGGRILGRVLEKVAAAMKPGMTTDDLDQIAQAEVERLGAKPAFLGHEGFPKTLCVSVNDEVVHGMPGQRIIKEGDVIGLDFGVRHKGLVTDSAITVALGAAGRQADRLLQVTQDALMVGIDQARAGNRVGDISEAVERHLKAAGLGVIKELAGHGVGRELWEEPTVPNLGRAGTGPLLRAGMTIAIEPMATLGRPGIEVLADKWTIATRDGSLAAQFEHTILITGGAPEILTLPA